MYPDLLRPEPVGALAYVHAVVLLDHALDLEALLVGPEPLPGVGLDGLLPLVPVDDRGGVAGEGADQPDVLAEFDALREGLLLGRRRT